MPTMSSNTLHRNPPYRAEHLGSLKRPDSLLKKRAELDADTKNTSDLADLAPYEDNAVKQIVEKQIQWGYHALTDGEYRRHMFWGNFFPNLNGFEVVHKPSVEIFREYAPDIAAFLETDKNPQETILCTGKISHTGKSDYLNQWNYLKSLVPQEKAKELKLTLPAPNWYHYRYKEGKAYQKDVYKNDDEYFADVAKAYQVELDILYKAGLRNVQFDDPNLACTSVTVDCSGKHTDLCS